MSQRLIDKVEEAFSILQEDYPGTVMYFDKEQLSASFSVNSSEALANILENFYGMTTEDAEVVANMSKETLRKVVIQATIERKKLEIKELEKQL